MSITRRASAILFSVAAVFLASTSGHGKDQDSRTGSVWVVNRDRGELVVFDAKTGTVLTNPPVPVGAGAHDICISEKAGKAYITAETINTVTTVDTRTLATDAIPVGPLPHHCEPSHDERTIYVSLASHTTTLPNTTLVPQYAAIDIDDNSVSFKTTSENPAARSHGLHPSFDGSTVYVSHDLGDELAGIDLDTGSIDVSVKPILRAEEAVATRSGNEVWVSSRGDGTVKRIDLRTNQITNSVSVGALAQPESVLLTPNERTLAVSLRASPATLAFIDTVDRALIGTVQLAGTGTFGDLAVMSNDGQYVYATFDAGSGGQGGVAVVRVKTGEVVDTWTYPGTGRPHGIWYSRHKLK